MCPELPLAPGAYYAEQKSEEHNYLTKRARGDSEFAIIETDAGVDIFVPYEVEPNTAVAAYTMESASGAVVGNLVYVPDAFFNNDQPVPEKPTAFRRLLGKIGLRAGGN